MFAFALIAAVSAIYGGVTQYQSGKAQAKQAEYNAEHEADVLENQAEQEKLNRRADEGQERKESRRRLASMEAAYAKSGVLIDGTPANYLNEQTETDELNIARGNQRSKQRGLGLKIAGQNSIIAGKVKSSGYKAKGEAALIGGTLKAGGSMAYGGAEAGWWS